MIVLVSVGLLGGFLFTRYGNERADHFTSKEVDAIHYLYNVAEPGSLWVAAEFNLPWRFQDVEKHEYMSLTTDIIRNIDELIELMENKEYPRAYLILTRSQKAYAELFAGLSPGSWEHLEKDLLESSRFQLIFSNEDAKIFVLSTNE
jgi:hypothetical protein